MPSVKNHHDQWENDQYIFRPSTWENQLAPSTWENQFNLPHQQNKPMMISTVLITCSHDASSATFHVMLFHVVCLWTSSWSTSSAWIGDYVPSMIHDQGSAGSSKDNQKWDDCVHSLQSDIFVDYHLDQQVDQQVVPWGDQHVSMVYQHHTSCVCTMDHP